MHFLILAELQAADDPIKMLIKEIKYMRISKRMIPLFMAALLCFAVPAGCSSSEKNPAAEPESKASVESKASDESSAETTSAETPSSDDSTVSGEGEDISAESIVSGEESKGEESEPEKNITSGIFYQTFNDETNLSSHNIYEAELCTYEDKMYLRLYNGYYDSVGSEDDLMPGPSTDIMGVSMEYSVPVSEAQGETIVFSGESDKINLKYTAPDTIELLIIDDYNDENENRNGTYVFKKPDASRLETPAAKHDPKSPEGKMDAGLAESARRTLNLSSDAELKAEDCEKITSLIAYSERESIINLDGIEYFKNLKEFGLSNSYVSDISALTVLNELESLQLSDNRIQVIPDLSACKKLKKIEISGEDITDIAPLAKIEKLEYLYMLDNRVKSIAPLKDNHSITYLYIDGTCINDWETISDNKTLKKALVSDYDSWLAIEEKAKEILDEIITDNMTDLEKQVRIAEYVQDFMEYSEEPDESDGKTYPIIYHGIIKNDGVCNNYARTANYLMNNAGLEVRICEGSGHMWNMIRLDGKWYEFDCTWNDNETLADWKWFNKSRNFVGQNKLHGMSNEIGTPYAAYDMPFMEYLRYA